MDTIETRDEPAPPVDTVYDGFISYSHAADDLLAPRLQAGLQRFAKPWWQRRALRMFRDEASLTANPHLWASITEALDQSDWFVLLLSPDAAESEWVNREVEYWLEHKDRDRIIPVVTDGEFGWSGDDIDATTNSAPPALYGVFTDEPRWVDLRFARTETQVDLNNASFRAAVADIASAIRGVPKDELESEEVRQHRRTVRTAYAAAIALGLLVVLAAAAAVFANGQRLEANAQRIAAEESAKEADTQRTLADQLAYEARTDALAANAVAQLDTDPELALLLATQSLARALAGDAQPNPNSLIATHRALQRHRTIYLLEGSPGNTPDPDGAVGGLSPDGTRLVVTNQGQRFEVLDIEDDAVLWFEEFETPDTTIRSVRFTADGSQVVALVSWSTVLDPFAASFPDDVPRGLYVYDADDGTRVRTIDLPSCPSKLVPSPLATYVDLTAPLPWVTVADLALATDPSGESRGTCDTFSATVGLLDPITGSFTEVDETVTGTRNQFGIPTIDATGGLLATGASGPGEVVDVATGEVLFEGYEGGISTLSSDGTLLLAGGHAAGSPLELWDLSDNDLVWSFPAAFTRVWFSSDGTTVYGVSPDGAAYVIDAATGDQLLRLLGHAGSPIAATMSERGLRLATFGEDFAARVWDLTPIRSEGRTYVVHDQPRIHLPASADLATGVGAVWGGDRRLEPELWEITVFDLETGETITEVEGGVPAFSPDGTRLAYRVVEAVEVARGDLLTEDEPGVRPRVGPVHILDLASGGILELDVPCVEYLTPSGSVPSTACRDPVEAFGLEWDLEFSLDGRLLAMADSHDDEMLVWDAVTGIEVGSGLQPGANPRAVAFTPDGTTVVFHLLGANDAVLRVYELDPFTLVTDAQVTEGTTFAEMVFTPDSAQLVAAGSDGDIAFFEAGTWRAGQPIRAHQGSVLDVAISPSGDLIASAGSDAFVRVWKDRTPVAEVQFEVDEIANVEFIDESHLLVTSGLGATAIVITLDPDELLSIARSRLTRTFTAEECAQFEVDPCPTLADLQQGAG